MSILLGTLLVFSSMFLIMIVLVQRGRGGGLTGALGGAGGQSAFGAKAGDVFTRITIGAAAVWIVLCVLTVKFVGSGSDPLDLGGVNTPRSGEVDSTFKPEDKAGGTGAGKTTGIGEKIIGTEKAGTEKPATETPATKEPESKTPAADEAKTPAAETPAAPATEPAAPAAEPAAEKKAAE